MVRPLVLAALLAVAGTAANAASTPAGSPPKSESGGKPTASTSGGSGGAKGFGELGSSREPIAIDADRLDVFDKDGRAVFTGNVIAVQGETTMRCTVMNVSYESKRGQKGQAQPDTPTSGGAAGGLAQDSAIRRIDCTGPVVIKTKTQTATGDKAEFDRVANKFFIIGNAALSDGPNVTRGERVAYDLSTGVANVEGGRVRALIVPGSEKDGGGKKAESKAEPKKADSKKVEAKKAEPKKVDAKKTPEREAKATPR